jgi:tetratricopeptide (TPR) repeat protein
MLSEHRAVTDRRLPRIVAISLVLVFSAVFAGCANEDPASVSGDRVETDRVARVEAKRNPGDPRRRGFPAVQPRPPANSLPVGAGLRAGPAEEGTKGARLRRTTVQRDPQRWALLIGVTKYSHLPSLRFCARDMQKLEEVLVESSGYPRKNVRLLADVGDGKSADATNNATVQAAWKSLLEQVQENDTVLFAFSGHGMEDAGKGYLMTSDADPKRVAETALAMSWVYGLLDQCPAKSKVVLVDACHSGATKGKSFSQQSLVGGDGVYGLFSCKSNQESWEDPNLQHGVFTYYLVNALRGEADLRENNGNGDQHVSADEVFQYLSRKVPTHVKSHFRADQQPFRRVASSGSHVLSQYKFRPVPENTALMTLPGLNGDWWFHESPWLLPLVRTALSEYLARKMDAGKVAELLNSPDVAATRKALRDAYEEIVRPSWWTGPPVETGIRTGSSVGAGLRAGPEVLYQLGNWRGGELRESEQAALLDGVKAAGDPHSLAVLQHHFGIKEAEANYKLALSEYEKQRPRSVGRYAACLVDYGRWIAGHGNHRQACARFQLARDLVTDSRVAPLFHIDAWCVEADARRRLGEWRQAEKCLKAAETIARERLGDSHPLMSHIHRRFAWMYMDQWKLTLARKHFEEANRTARLLARSDPDAASVRVASGVPDLRKRKLGFRARVFLHHNNHGLAMCSRYTGDSADAVRRYRKLQQAISAELRSTTAPAAVLALKGRLLNTMERLADCYLFTAKPQGATGGWNRQCHRAADVYRQSYRLAVDLSDSPSDATRDRLTSKRIMALSLLESPDAAVVAELVSFKTQKTDPGLFHQIAAALAGLRLDASETGRQHLRDTLVRVAGKDRKKFSRDEYDLLFLASRALIQAETADKPRSTLLATDVERLFDIIPSSFRRPEVLPYQRPFYDAAITAWIKHVAPARMVDLLSFVSIAKTGAQLGLLGSGRTVVFYFPADDSAAGYALVYSSDGKGQIVTLTETTGQIVKRATSKEPPKTPLALPPPLEPIFNAKDTDVHWLDVVLKLDSPRFPYPGAKSLFFLAE